MEQLGTVKSCSDELAHDERRVLLRQVLRTVPGERNFGSVAPKLAVTRFLPG